MTQHTSGELGAARTQRHLRASPAQLQFLGHNPWIGELLQPGAARYRTSEDLLDSNQLFCKSRQADLVPTRDLAKHGVSGTFDCLNPLRSNSLLQLQQYNMIHGHICSIVELFRGQMGV